MNADEKSRPVNRMKMQNDEQTEIFNSRIDDTEINFDV